MGAFLVVLYKKSISGGIRGIPATSETFFGKNKGKSTEEVLKRWTIICLVVLAVLAVIFFILQIDAIWTA